MTSPHVPSKAVLVQLSHALNDRNHWFCNKPNVPLAAGYMRALARSRGLDQRLAIEILEPRLADHAGDRALVTALSDRATDVLALSLYPWNLSRSLWVAEQLRAARPGVVIIAGGPEVNDATVERLLGSGQLDIAIPGEGEVSFCDALAALVDGRPLTEVGGLALWRDGTLVQTGRRPTLVDLDAIPSPFIHGDIDARHYRQVHIIFERGCIYSCNYCHWWPEKRSRGRFSVERIGAELVALRAAGVKEVILLDAAINTSPRFVELTDVLERVNGDGKIEIKVQVLFDHLERDQVERLARGGVRRLELGLQSTDPATLKQAQRPTDVGLLRQALELCAGLPVELQIDFIMGLPGDSLDGVRRTARSIRELCQGKRLAQVSPFVLSVGSATQLRREAKRHRLRFQPEPPYRVLSVGDLDYPALRGLRMEIPAALGAPEHPLFAYDRPHYALNLFAPQLALASSPDPGMSRPTAGPRDSVGDQLLDTIHIACTGADAGHAHPFGAKPVCDRLAQLTTLWFDVASPENCAAHMAEAVDQLTTPNPFIVWDLVLETRGPFDLDVMRQLVAAVKFRVHNLDWDSNFVSPVEGDGWSRVATRPFVIIPLGAAPPAWMTAAAAAYPLIHAVTIEDAADARRQLLEVGSLPGEGVLIQLVDGDDPTLVHAVMTELFGLDRRVRGFRNLALEALFQAELARRERRPRPSTPYADRGVCLVAPDGGVTERGLSRRQTLLDLTQLCLAARQPVSARVAAG